MDFPSGPFDIIYADPAWRFASNSDAKPGRNARRHYDCMTLGDIAAMPVLSIAARPAALFLWATVPMLPHALNVMDDWGFRYVSQMVWVKPSIGTGFWCRNRHELLLIGKHGQFPVGRPAPFPDSVIEAPKREHSRKPDQVHTLIEAAFPEARKIELFARTQRPGWTAWGSEVGKFEGAA